ncbi:MAG TPA: hypothetical protein VF972_03575, partial [Actinomycetota bacterium]
TGAKVLGTQSATGKQASTYTYGTANHPTAIWVKVTASPDQNVYGGWTLVCQKGSEQKPGERNFAGPTPFIQQIPFPVPDPDTCTVAAEAALDGTGTITVTLLVK